MNAEELEKIGLVAIVRSRKEVPLKEVADALVRGGIQAVELTLNTPGAIDGIKMLRENYEGKIFAGMGTVLGPDDAKAAIAAGAQFIVTPTVQIDTIKHCKDAGVPIACGAMTPTEALAVHQAGADFVKLFPAESLGVSYIKSILGPLSFLKIVPTGGVNKTNIAQFVDAGCVGVALGSNLVSADVLATRNWEKLEMDAREYVDLWRNARQGC